jgi:hypothetical protein
MKKYFILLIATVLSICTFAQDVIVTKDSKKIDAKILEVSKSEIKYKEADNLEGPTFVLEVDDINSIIYSNGKVVLYNGQQSVKNTIQQEPLVREETKQTVIVDFEIKPTSNPLMYRFPNLSSGAVDFRWDFGDGTFSFAKDEAMKAYEKAGTYTITLTANVGERQYVQRKILEVGVEERSEQEQTDRLNQQLVESGAQLGQAIQNLIEVKNSYALDIKNTTKYPYRINLDGHILGVVNPYKTERFIVSIEIYGRMQAVQTSGYVFSPTIKEYKIPRQQKQTACTVVIK